MARKIYSFAIEIDGVDEFLIQTVKKPKVENGRVSFGGANGKNIKESSGKIVGDAELTKIKPINGSDTWAWDWLTQAFNGTPSDYKKDLVFKELAPDGATTLNRWLWEDSWVVSVDDSEYKKGEQQEVVIETVVISVDDVKKL